MSIISRPGKIYCCTDLRDSYSLAAQGNVYNKKHIAQITDHCVKSVFIRSYSGLYFSAFALNTEK